MELQTPRRRGFSVLGLMGLVALAAVAVATATARSEGEALLLFPLLLYGLTLAVRALV